MDRPSARPGPQPVAGAGGRCKGERRPAGRSEGWSGVHAWRSLGSSGAACPGIVAHVRLAAAAVTASRQKVYGTVYSMMRSGRLQGKPIATTPFGAGVTKVLRFAPPRGYHDVDNVSGSIACDVRSHGAGPLARRPFLTFQVRHQEAVMRQKGQPPARGWKRVRRSLSRGLRWTVPALLALVAPVEAQQSSSVL